MLVPVWQMGSLITVSDDATKRLICPGRRLKAKEAGTGKQMKNWRAAGMLIRYTGVITTARDAYRYCLVGHPSWVTGWLDGVGFGEESCGSLDELREPSGCCKSDLQFNFTVG